MTKTKTFKFLIFLDKIFMEEFFSIILGLLGFGILNLGFLYQEAWTSTAIFNIAVGLDYMATAIATFTYHTKNKKNRKFSVRLLGFDRNLKENKIKKA